MAFIPTPNTVRCSVVGLIGTRPIVNTLWFRKDTPYTLADLATVLAALEAQWVFWVLPLLSSTYGVERYEAYAQDSDSAPTFAVAAGPSEVGGVTTGVNLSVNAAAAVTFYTAARGRTSRGRNFIAGLKDSMIADVAHLTSTFQADLREAYEGARTAMLAAGSSHVVVSKFYNKAPRTEGLARNVTAYSVDSRIDSQRHRLGPA